MAKRKVEDLFVDTKFNSIIDLIKMKWKLALIAMILFFIYNQFGWTWSLVLCLLIGGEVIINSYRSIKYFNEHRRVYQIADYYITKYEKEWLTLEESFDIGPFIENEKYSTDQKNEDKYKVKENYEERYLSSHEKAGYHEDMLHKIEDIRNRVKAICNPVIDQFGSLDETFYKIANPIRKVLSTKFSHPEPILYFYDFLGAYKDFFIRMTNYHEKELARERYAFNKGNTGEDNPISNEPNKYPAKNYMKHYQNVADCIIVITKINEVYQKIIFEIIEDMKQDKQLMKFINKRLKSFEK